MKIIKFVSNLQVIKGDQQDENIIIKYKEIKANNGDYNDLQNLLKTIAPSSNWTTWDYWNGHIGEMNGYGYTQKPIQVPDTGLYYMWVYFSGNNLKNLYGYILVDNLQPEIALDGISLPKTANVELGKTLTLFNTFTFGLGGDYDSLCSHAYLICNIQSFFEGFH